MIDLIPTSEQQGIAESLAAFLSDKLPVERHRADRAERRTMEWDLWKQLAELGCFGLSLEGEHGGVGFTLAEEILAFREYGRYLVSPAMLTTVLAARIAVAAGLSDLAAAFLAGGQRAGLARPLAARVGPVAGGQFHLIDARDGDHAVAWSDSGAALFAPGAFIGREPQASLDASVSLARARLGEARPLAWVDAAQPALPLVASVLCASMLVGISEAVRDMAVAYAKTRVQFGVPIGTFQGVKHKCANIAMWTEAAWAQTAYAALSLRERLPDARFHAVNAAMVASEAAMLGARENIQIHGGMGFTAELNAHLFLKRAHLLRQLLPSAVEMQRKLLQLSLHT